MSQDPSESGRSLAAFFDVLRRRFWLVLLCMVAVPAAAFAWSQRQEEKYEAHATVLLESSGFEASLASPVDGPDQGEATESLATDVGVAALETIAQRTEQTLARRGVETTVPGKVDVATDGEANVIQITAEDTDPEKAALIANAYARQFVLFRRAEDRRRVRAARRTLRQRLAVEGAARRRQIASLDRQRRRALRSLGALSDESRNGARGEILDARAGELRDRIAALRERDDEQRERVASLVTLERLQTGNARVVDPAEVPASPSSPDVARNVVAGLSLGLLLGIVLAVLFEALDRRVRDPDEISEIYDAPLLGVVPYSPILADVGATGLRPPALDREAFRMIQTTLQYFNGGEPTSVLVTSATQGEGKTTISWHVAQAGAELGQKVLLVEADLRHPAIAERLGAENDVGLSDVLRGHVSRTDAAVEIAVGEARERPGTANGHGPTNGAAAQAPVEPLLRPTTVDVLFAGRPMSDPRSLLASEAMAALVHGAERDYDLVVVDSPPLSVVSDGVPLVGMVSGVLVVTSADRDVRGLSKMLHDQLQHLNARVLGVVVNAFDQVDGPYGAVYGYARDYAKSR